MDENGIRGKEFLRQYLDCENRILSRQRRIAHLKEQAVSLSQTLRERVQSSGTLQRQAEIMDLYMDMQAELVEEVRRFRQVQGAVRSAVEAVTDSRERDVLERYYIEGMTLEQTAEDLGYCRMQVNRIHKQAVAHIASVT